MATMATKLPSDAFWPSGAIDTDVRLSFPTLSSCNSSSTIISPLTLPRGAAGYFDQRIHGGNPKAQVYSPLSPGVRGPGLQQQSFLSPHALHDQYRSSSLPPQARQSTASPVGQENSSRSSQDSSGSFHGLSFNGSNGHPRSLSDSNSGPSQASMIRRLIAQNGRIREAWEAERKYMEANRERAEEVYKEERALMEEERAEWETEKALLLREIERLQGQLLGGAGNMLSLRNGNIMSHQGSFSSATGLRGGAAWEASPESMKSSTHSSQSNDPAGHKNLAVFYPASLGGSPGPALKHSSLPQLRTASNVLEPLPERISIGHIPSSGLSPISATASETDGSTLVPVVDVQEIIPELEGIPLKAPAIQKPTFTDGPSAEGSNASSRSSSPQNSSDEAKAPPRAGKEQTLQVLAAHESARLTMHAGHTPSHSLSLLTTVASSGAATATSSSGESTPTIQQGDGPFGQVEAVVQMQEQVIETAQQQPSNADFIDDHPEQVYEPSEGDLRLKGPLMVRNMPAHDEIFFRRLSDKLEEVAQDREASLPAVLKDADSSEEAKAQVEIPASEASEASSTTEKDSSSTKSGDDEEDFEIPLKIKKSNNFGAPFGSSRW
ncbi:hypothetical protein QBC36DRAFT_31712 [Triangularia setosa]|uniref:Uncharacterized protein n=1 Tax=Triangularia setosa TaxID=2587417 RepID=A0AAN6W408_9PEZI|nr:hypothetical protein QBC36DRAFT_31712 [Podospora setosa]